MSYNIDGVVEVLNKGYIKLVDVMGSDSEICTAARVSYHEGSTKKKNEDKGLIDHLLRHRHTSPFEMGEMKFEIKLPIFVERQWVRHRTCSMNEMSARYSILPNEFYVPEAEDVKAQSQSNHQGREDGMPPVYVAAYRRDLEDIGSKAYTKYEDHLSEPRGVARELARCMLPINIYTKKVWKMNLHNLFHFLKLRTDEHAQWEIRQYANHIEKFVEHHFPWSYASWRNHVKYAVTLSRDEFELVKMSFNAQLLKELIMNSRLSKTRRTELRAKLGLRWTS